MNTKKKITILSILIALILVVAGTSITFAIWSSKHVTESNIVQSGCLNIKFTQGTADINAPRISPGTIYYPYLTLPNNDNDEPEIGSTELSDSTTEIKENSYYAFIITNTCNTQASYNINMETLNGTDLDSKYLAIYINAITVGNKSNINDINASDFENEDNVLISKEDLLANYPLVNTTLDNALYSNNLYRGILKANETHFFELFALLPHDLDNIEAQEKTWMSKITINSTTPSPIKVSFDTDGGNEITENKTVYLNDEYGDLPTPTKEGYVFKYWYLDEDETKGINENTIVSKNNNHTLKAKYVNNDVLAILEDNTFYRFVTLESLSDIDNPDNIKINILPFKGYISEEEILNNYQSSSHFLSSNEYQINNSDSGDTNNAKYEIFFLYDFEKEDTLNIYYYCYNATIAIKKDMFGATESMYVNVSFDNPNLYFKHFNKIDLSGINTSLMTSMEYMFTGCESLEELVLDGIDTSNVYNMSGMFEKCKKLKNLDLSNFVTSNVRNMMSMFLNCSSLETINLSNFDTSNVVYMTNMFTECSSLNNIDLSNFNTVNVKSMGSMFSDCTSLKEINLSNFKDNSLVWMSSMFENCRELKIIDLSGFSGKEIDDEAMLCNTDVDTIIGYTPSEKAYTCWISDTGVS